MKKIDFLKKSGWQIKLFPGRIHSPMSASELYIELKFKDFKSAFSFVKKVAIISEDASHHPEISIKYNVVKLSCISHDVGKVTGRDYELAIAITKLFKNE